MDWSLFGWFAGSAFVLYWLFGVHALLGLFFSAGVGFLCTAVRAHDIPWLWTLLTFAACIVVGAFLGRLGRGRRGGGGGGSGLLSAFGDVADIAGDMLD